MIYDRVSGDGSGMRRSNGLFDIWGDEGVCGDIHGTFTVLGMMKLVVMIGCCKSGPNL